MASPTAAELETQLKNAVALLENLASANTIVNDLNTYEQSLESDYVVSQITAASQVRARVGRRHHQQGLPLLRRQQQDDQAARDHLRRRERGGRQHGQWHRAPIDHRR